MSEPIPIALIGAGRRAFNVYARILEGMHQDVKVVGAWNRTADGAERLGTRCGVPHFTDLARLKDETGAVAGIINVNYGANGEIGRAAVEAGFHILAETPIAHDLADADAIIHAAGERGLKVEVAEQLHRRPVQQIILKLIAAGVFGNVYTAMNDFSAHGYHGVSVIRSYLGFARRPLRVEASVHDYPLTPHWSQFSGSYEARTERQEHAIVEFAGDRVGLFHWTGVGYDSALRWWRGSRFLAEKGMGVCSGPDVSPRIELTLHSRDHDGPLPIQVVREMEGPDGGGLARVIAYTESPAESLMEWRNPFGAGPGEQIPAWNDDEIAVASCVKSLVDAIRLDADPSYGPLQARADQEITLAMSRSAERGGQPVPLPL